MTRENHKGTDEAQIRKLIDDQVTAVREKDVDGSTSNYAPNILSFDVVNPLQKTGLEARKKRAAEWFSTFLGPIGYELRDLRITAGDDVAFCHSLNRVNGTLKGGGVLDMWWRATVCYRKIGGKWMVTHEHNSVPFDVETGKASLDLKP
jgi:ketosteroid isomerase-like protein